MFLWSWLDGIGGTVEGSFFRAEKDVDESKLPGTTPVFCPESLWQVVTSIFSGQAFLYSPNSTWFLIACCVWYVAPYQLDKTVEDQFQERLVVNHVLAFVYIAFWHVSLYWWKLGRRPFVMNRTYQASKVLHNVFYTWLGVVQWTITETIFLYGYQQGRIAHHAPDSLFEDPVIFIQTLIASILLPNLRDIHFYFAHRLIHVQFLYKYIHSLHHRNTDIEPFSGLCMHPIEHMYYYTSYFPLLIWKFHPFLLFWMGVHLVLSPAASHSGYEDHFSADLAHYLHHRHADCNYGVPQSIPFDRWFGTFRDQLKPSSRRPTLDSKARLLGDTAPAFDHILFNLGWMLLWFLAWTYRTDLSPIAASLAVSVGPVLIAFVLALTGRRRNSINSPFDRDPVWSQLLHACMGMMLGVFPITYLLYFVL